MMLSDRAEHEREWRNIAIQFAPKRGRFSLTEKGKTDLIRRNSRPRMIPDEAAAGLKGGLTSQSRQWFSLVSSSPRLMEYESVKAWCHDATERLHDIMGRTNLYDEIVGTYKELLVFGTGCLFIEEDPLEVFHCRSFTVGEYAIGHDDRQRVNRFSRILRYTPEDLVNEFGEKSVPEEVLRKLQYKEADNTTYEVRHLIEPNTEYMPEAPGQQGMRYRSLYWLPGHIEPEFLRIHGYNEFPALVPRWRLVGADLYGTEHPGQVSIDDARTIQDIEVDVRRALKLGVSPAMLAPSTMRNRSLDLSPGMISYFDPVANDPRPSVTSAFEVRFDHPSAAEKIDRLTLDIEKAFYVDLFRMWAQDMRSGRTATEIEAREQEKMYALEPVLTRLMHDLLDPMVDRIFNIVYRAGYMTPMPPEMMESGHKIEYTSVLARLQKLSLQGGLETLIAVSGNLAQLQGLTGRPEILDKLDFDTIVDQFAEMYAITGAVFGKDEAEKIREARQRQEQQTQAIQSAMQAAQAAPQLAGAAKDLSQAQMSGGGTALDMLTGMGGLSPDQQGLGGGLV